MMVVIVTSAGTLRTVVMVMMMFMVMVMVMMMFVAPHQKIFLICRTPQTVRKLVEGGIDLKDINVGNMHFSEGKKQISSKVYVDDQDLADLRFIKQRGVNVFIQDVPGDQKEQIPD